MRKISIKRTLYLIAIFALVMASLCIFAFADGSLAGVTDSGSAAGLRDMNNTLWQIFGLVRRVAIPLAVICAAYGGFMWMGLSFLIGKKDIETQASRGRAMAVVALVALFCLSVLPYVMQAGRGIFSRYEWTPPGGGITHSANAEFEGCTQADSSGMEAQYCQGNSMTERYYNSLLNKIVSVPQDNFSSAKAEELKKNVMAARHQGQITESQKNTLINKITSRTR